MSLFKVFDDYIATWPILLIGVLETTMICWVYGFWNYSKDLRTMMNWLPEKLIHGYAVTFWGLVTPFILIFIMIYSWIQFKPRGNQLEEGVGWTLTMSVGIWMPAAAIYVIFTRKGNFMQKLKASISPTKKWGPYLDKWVEKTIELNWLCLIFLGFELRQLICTNFMAISWKKSALKPEFSEPMLHLLHCHHQPLRVIQIFNTKIIKTPP